jgi:hypothetical protein
MIPDDDDDDPNKAVVSSFFLVVRTDEDIVVFVLVVGANFVWVFTTANDRTNKRCPTIINIRIMTLLWMQ